jgi:hypothetical protein
MEEHIKPGGRSLYADRFELTSRHGAILTIAWLICAIFQSVHFRWVINPDGVAYAVAAERLVSGHYAMAYNSYWGPAYSWLIASIYSIGVHDWFYAIRASNAVAGLAAGISVYALARELGLRGTGLSTAMLGVFIPLLYWSVEAFPDLLFAAIFTTACTVNLVMLRKPTVAVGACWGFILGLLYLVKSFGAPISFVLFCATLFSLLYRNTDSRRRVGAALTTGVLAWICIAGPWIFLISQKDGHFTLGSSGSYNNSLFGRNTPPNPQSQLLNPPPFEGAVSTFDNAALNRLKPWSPFASAADFLHLAKRTAGNILIVAPAYALLALFACVIVGWDVARAKSQHLYRRSPQVAAAGPAYFLLIGATVPYVVGYVTVTVEDRYLYGAALITWVACLSRLSALTPTERNRRWAFPLAAVIMTLPSALFTVSAIAQSSTNMWTDAAKTARELKSVVPMHASVVSNGQWHRSIVIGFHNSYKFYGEIGGKLGAPIEQLGAHGIEYLFVYKHGEPLPNHLVPKATRVFKTANANLEVFKLAPF